MTDRSGEKYKARARRDQRIKSGGGSSRSRSGRIGAEEDREAAMSKKEFLDGISNRSVINGAVLDVRSSVASTLGKGSIEMGGGGGGDSAASSPRCRAAAAAERRKLAAAAAMSRLKNG